ncbi:MAG: FHA domain-containing protein [candidate division WOR-3 bacterium]
MSIKCPNCGLENPNGTTHCQQCFSPLSPIEVKGTIEENVIKCPDCGTKNPPFAKFCGNCGKRLSQIVQQPVEEKVVEQKIESKEVAEQTTVLQVKKLKLIHVATNTEIEVPANKDYILIGRQGGARPVDIDVSPFKDSNIVSRNHAAIIIEPTGNVYIEDLGSTNGTFINYREIRKGDKCLLHDGDKIMLGREEKVVFIFRIEG